MSRTRKLPRNRPSGRIIVPNDYEILLRTIYFPPLSTSPIIKSIPSAARPPSGRPQSRHTTAVARFLRRWSWHSASTHCWATHHRRNPQGRWPGFRATVLLFEDSIYAEIYSASGGLDVSATHKGGAVEVRNYMPSQRIVRGGHLNGSVAS